MVIGGTQSVEVGIPTRERGNEGWVAWYRG